MMSFRRALAAGTLVVGTLDLLDAVVFFGLHSGVPPVRIFQSIAAGWLGRAASTGGAVSATLGVATHYFIAFAIVWTYAVASRRIELLVRRPWLSGAVYGVAVYLFMNLVVIPLSAIGPQRFVAGPVVNGLLIHVFGIGIPSALFAAAIRRP
jgi:uncharacterized membrane protein YagU involved in acid resistance